MISLIDTHQHLWDLSVLELPWLADVPEIASDHVMSTYADASRGFEVSGTIYMEVDVSIDQVERERDHILAICDDPGNPLLGATLRARPGEAGFSTWVRSFSEDQRVKGFRQVLHPPELPDDYCLGDAFVDDVRLLGEIDKHFDLCVRPSTLGKALELVRRCPETRFVLDHCGNAQPEIVNGSLSPDDLSTDDVYWHTREQWLDEMSALGAEPNVICKVSGIIARCPEGAVVADCLEETVNHCLRAFGPERIVFGSDWPVCTLGAGYAAWVNSLESITASWEASAREGLFQSNARRFYGL